MKIEIAHVAPAGQTSEILPGQIPNLPEGRNLIATRVSSRDPESEEDLDDIRAVWLVEDKNDYALRAPEMRTGSVTGPVCWLEITKPVKGHANLPDNSLRVLVLKKDWTLEHYIIAVTFQDEKTFLVVSLRASVPLRRYKGSITANHSQMFPEFMRKLELEPEVQDAPEIDVAPERAPRVELREGQGIIKWFHPARGVGQLTLRDGRKARIHWRLANPDKDGFRCFAVGQVLDVASVSPLRERGTSFTWEVQSLGKRGVASKKESPTKGFPLRMAFEGAKA